MKEVMGIMKSKLKNFLPFCKHNENNEQASATGISDLFFNQTYIKQTAVVRKDTKNLYRIEKIISELSSYENDKEGLVADTKNGGKKVLFFFCVFIAYILLGAALFFYIEECSGAEITDDPSTEKFRKKVTYPRFEDLNSTCRLIFLTISKTLGTFSRKVNLTYKHPENNTSRTLPDVNVTSDDVYTSIEARYSTYFEFCKHIIEDSAYPVVKEGKKFSCELSNLQMLRYTEFTMFTILTIGYGNMTPATNIGRGLLILYAMFGIPIAVTLYGITGKLLLTIINYFVKCLRRKVQGNTKSDRYLHVQVLLFSLFLMLPIVLFGCLLTSNKTTNDLEFPSSFYFWFVSLTLIGYGDITLNHESQIESPWFMLLSLVTILLGLAVSATIIEAFSTVIQHKDCLTVTNKDDIRDKEQLDTEVAGILLQLGSIPFSNQSKRLSSITRQSTKSKKKHIKSGRVRKNGSSHMNGIPFSDIKEEEETSATNSSRKDNFSFLNISDVYQDSTDL